MKKYRIISLSVQNIFIYIKNQYFVVFVVYLYIFSFIYYLALCFVLYSRFSFMSFLQSVDFYYPHTRQTKIDSIFLFVSVFVFVGFSFLFSCSCFFGQQLVNILLLLFSCRVRFSHHYTIIVYQLVQLVHLV